MLKIILVIYSLFFPPLALAHSWYPPHCCSDKDCKPVPCEDLLTTTDGGVKYEKYVFTKQQVYPSKDSKCHVCINHYNNPICAFVQNAV